MMGRSHIVLAGAIYLALAAHPVETPLGTLAAPVLQSASLAQPQDALAVSGLLATFAGLGPDLDKSGSMLARWLGHPGRILSRAIERSAGHRGPLHSLLGTLLVYALANGVGAWAGGDGLGAVISFGWLVHLVTDGWTSRGVPWLWPFAGSIRLPLRFATNTWVEPAVLTLALWGCVWWAGGLDAILPLLRSAF